MELIEVFAIVQVGWVLVS